MALSATAKGWFEDWMTGDDSVGFLVKFTLADATVLWAQIFKSPGYRLMTSDEEVTPRIRFTTPFSISVLNSNFGQLDPETGRTSFEQFKVGTLEDGAFELINEDGELNSWIDEIWADADGEIQVGTLTTAQGSFETFFSFKVAQEPVWSMGSRGGGIIRAPIKSSIINLNLQAQEERFAGSGGLEGTDSLEGVQKPRLFGEVTHYRPVLVSPADERYLVSSEAIDDVTEAYERGEPIGSANFTVTAASGYFDLNNTASNEPVTCDATGEDIDSGSYTDDAGKILDYLLGTLWDGAVDSTSVTDYSTDFTAGIGVALGGTDYQRTRSEALSWALKPLGICFPEQDGTEFYVQVIDKPEDQTVSLAFDESHIAAVSTREGSPPVWRVNLGYDERTVIDDPLPADPADREPLMKPRSYIMTDDSTVQDDYPNALDLELPTPIFGSVDAASVATTVLALLKVRRTIFEIDLVQQAFHAWLGDYVSIKNADFPQISSLKKVLVTGYTFDLDNRQVTMEAWG